MANNLLFDANQQVSVTLPAGLWQQVIQIVRSTYQVPEQLQAAILTQLQQAIQQQEQQAAQPEPQVVQQEQQRRK